KNQGGDSHDRIVPRRAKGGSPFRTSLGILIGPLSSSRRRMDRSDRKAMLVCWLSLLFAACSSGKGPGPVADGGSRDGGSVSPNDSQVVTCPNAPIPTPAQGLCSTTAGDSNLLLQGTVLTPGRILRNGHLLIDPSGNIVCADCDCS